jgi:hypothetical protein
VQRAANRVADAERALRGAPTRLAGVADWATISGLATGAGTLVLAAATFASVRSANRAARAAELSLAANLRPLLLPSRLDDPQQKIGFADMRWFHLGGGLAIAAVDEAAIYLAISLRNVGQGIAVLHGWRFDPELRLGDSQPPPLEEFTNLSRDLYVPAGDVGFWQGTYRDPSSERFAVARDALTARDRVVVDILYGDHEGGQRVVSRFMLQPRDETTWLASAGRHWNVDRDDPRPR